MPERVSGLVLFSMTSVTLEPMLALTVFVPVLVAPAATPLTGALLKVIVPVLLIAVGPVRLTTLPALLATSETNTLPVPVMPPVIVMELLLVLKGARVRSPPVSVIAPAQGQGKVGGADDIHAFTGLGADRDGIGERLDYRFATGDFRREVHRRI